MKRMLLLAGVLSPILACATGGSRVAESNDALTSLDETAFLDDLENVGNALRTLYAPLEQKKARYGFDLDRELATARAAIHAGKTEADRIRPFYELLAKLQDPGVQLALASHADDGHRDHFFDLTIAPVDGKWVLTGTDGTTSHDGDVIVAIDGTPIEDVVHGLASIVSGGLPGPVAVAIAQAISFRPFYAPDALQPRGPTARVELVAADGSHYMRDVAWSEAPTLDATLDASASRRTSTNDAPIADFDPYALGDAFAPYWTPIVAKAFALTPIAPDESPGGESLVANALTVDGRTIALVRIPSFAAAAPEANANVDWLRALVHDRKPDAVVLDLTANIGGDPAYALGIASVFVDAPVPNALESMHADRQNVWTLVSAAQSSGSAILASRAADLQTAYDARQPLGPFAPVAGIDLGASIDPGDAQFGVASLAPVAAGHYDGPVLVLTDEQTASSAELLALVLQSAGIAKTFGARTAGSGSRSDSSLRLQHTDAFLTYGRSVFGVRTRDGTMRLVEDEGVTPDFAHPRTVAEVRAGSVDYVTGFSRVASTLTRAGR